MPNLKQELMKRAGLISYTALELSHSYLQFPDGPFISQIRVFHHSERELHPTRVLNGTKNAVMYFPPRLASRLHADLHCTSSWWLDDITIHLITIIDHLQEIIHCPPSVCTTASACNHRPSKCTCSPPKLAGAVHSFLQMAGG